MTQIKNKHYARSKLLLLAAKLFIFTAVFWLLVYFFDIIVNGFIANFLISIFGDIPALYFFYNNYQQLTALFYAGMMLLICFIDLYKTARGVISINQDIELLLDKNRQLNDLPDDLQATELALKEIKYAIERNEQAAREAEQRKNDLVVYLAHDLKTPLTSVIGYLTLLIESPDLPLAHRVKYMDITLKKAYRLEQLINEFFEITRYNLQSIVLEHNRLDLTLFLRQMGDEFSPILAEKRLVLAMDIQSSLVIIADADKLARVFDNILRNAVNYSYPDTTITISAGEIEGMIQIDFINQGDQIPEEKLTRIFEKFFRMDEARSSGSGGAGLGLAIAKHIIKLHGGKIMVQSNRDYTQFSIRLPKDNYPENCL